LTAAETGHLVLATLHTSGAQQTADRILDVFPPDKQAQVRLQMAGSLEGIVSQQLLPSSRGGRVAVVEVLIGTPAVRALIREGKTHMLASSMQAGRHAGMQSAEMALEAALQDGTVSQDTAALYRKTLAESGPRR